MPKEDWQFKPWQSGNPAWKPPWTRSIETLFRDAIKKIAEDNPEVKDVERELIVTLLAKAKKWDIKAMEIYLDRLYWKPKQKIETELTGSMNVISPEDRKLLNKVLSENI